MEMAAWMKAAKLSLVLFVCYYHFTFLFHEYGRISAVEVLQPSDAIQLNSEAKGGEKNSGTS